MKIKEGYVIRQVMGNYVVIATGAESMNFHGMIKLNETAASIWTYISEGKNEDEIISCMIKEYDVDEEKLREDVKNTVRTLIDQGFVEL